jgi:hypothetical protein
VTRFSERQVAVFDLPLRDGVTILRPEQVVLRFGDGGGTTDVGALCYLRRGKNQRLRGRLGREIDLSSYSAKRADRVMALIDHISQEASQGGRRTVTLKHMVDRLINSFMDWADSNGHHDALDTADAAREAFRGYSSYVQDCVGQNLISTTTGAQYQAKVLALLSGFHEVDDLHRGIRLLQQENAEAATSPPLADDQARVLAMCEALFDGLTELVLEGRPYPFKLAMPGYLNWNSVYLWVFPTRYWCMPPHAIAVRGSMKYPYWKYDYVNGRVTPRDELSTLLGYDGYGENHRATARVKEANADLNHISRRQVGIVAHNAFVVLFAANTGMNRSQLLSLPWAGQHDVTTERQGFRVIKWRANNRVCHFEIEASFLPRFRRFLELRNYLLSSAPYDGLFCTLGRETEPAPGPMLPSVVGAFFELLRTLDPQLPIIGFRQWRAAKSDWLVRNTDPATAAMILQNSEQTVLKAYAAGSESVQREEMSAFFASVREVVINRGERIENAVERAVGVCTSFGAPTQCEGSITPDCRQVEGCLFCAHYKVHADECDTKKLLSCRYCLHQTSHLASSEEQFQQMFGPILDRIQVLLDEINLRDPGIVDRLHPEVEAGDLDPYWASKMEMLINLEVAA